MNEYTAYKTGYKARMKDEAQHCLFTDGVTCDPKFNSCDGCGWHPAVSRARLQKICETMGVVLPVIQKEEDHGEGKSV